VIFAQQLPAMVDLGWVDQDTAVTELAQQAEWSAGRLREATLQLQLDPDVTPRTLACCPRAADRAQHRRAHRPDLPWPAHHSK